MYIFSCISQFIIEKSISRNVQPHIKFIGESCSISDTHLISNSSSQDRMSIFNAVDFSVDFRVSVWEAFNVESWQEV